KEADILLVNVKDSKNLVPALTSKQVDAWVGPSPHPEVAVTSGLGNIVLDMKDMPPKGQWEEFPCCVATASQEMIDNHPEIVQAFTDILTKASAFAMEQPEVLAQDLSAWCGIDLEAAKKNAVVFTTEPNENWFRGESIIYDALKDTDKLTDQLKDTDFETAKESLFQFSFVEKSLQKLSQGSI
ncbi:MAG: ABC transporter substrate-binding protein, partial [bacterium]